MHNPTTLYIKDSRGDIRTWSIAYDSDVIVMHYGLENGQQIVQEEIIYEGKQSRSIEEQVQHRMQSRINRMIDKGYVYDREQALEGATNALGFKKPMLAHPLKNIKKIDWSTAWIQPKYDGHRCIITRQYGELIAYSRNGKLIESIDHILNCINSDLEEGQYIDGELYCHGIPLQTISSWIKRHQEDSKKLQYIAYDIMEEMGYGLRYGLLKELIQGWGRNIVMSETLDVNGLDEAKGMMMEYRQQDYEGAIVRHGGTWYEDGKRSRSLVKLKERMDAEFFVTDVIPSREEWGILVCMTESGKEFKVSAPGCINQKTHILRHKEEYIGKDVTIEFPNYTVDGIPFHPVAIRFREDV